MNDFPLTESNHIWVWLDGVKYEGTWTELYDKRIIQKAVEICWTCQANFLNLKQIQVLRKTDFGDHWQTQYICEDCEKKDDY